MLHFGYLDLDTHFHNRRTLIWSNSLQFLAAFPPQNRIQCSFVHSIKFLMQNRNTFNMGDCDDILASETAEHILSAHPLAVSPPPSKPRTASPLLTNVEFENLEKIEQELISSHDVTGLDDE
ncbi:hypothetical protein P8452_64647 [Trifolium repens]|nr:hypothetical protein P8452_64647 [Trifolium repens]